MKRVVLAAALAGVLALGTAVPAGASAGWSQQAVPSPPVAQSDQLNAISCGSASRCVAVGTYITRINNQFGLFERWNGSRWAVHSTPSGDQSDLFGVACVSAADCIAVGDNATGPLAESWNGARWTVQPVPVSPGMTNGVLARGQLGVVIRTLEADLC